MRLKVLRQLLPLLRPLARRRYFAHCVPPLHLLRAANSERPANSGAWQLLLLGITVSDLDA